MSNKSDLYENTLACTTPPDSPRSRYSNYCMSTTVPFPSQIEQTHCRNKSHTIPLCSIRVRNPHWTGGESSKTACVFFPPPQFFNDNDTFSPPRITEGRADGDPGLSYPPSPSDLCAHVRQSESARIAREDAKYDALPETAKIDVSTGYVTFLRMFKYLGSKISYSL